ncbi:MAG: hypothetical protein SOW57_02930, partial [Prevotella sp.]|nr:hypothetical protein [Prevotella sp.]
HSQSWSEFLSIAQLSQAINSPSVLTTVGMCKISIEKKCFVVLLSGCLVVCHVNTFNQITKQQNH